MLELTARNQYAGQRRNGGHHHAQRISRPPPPDPNIGAMLMASGRAFVATGFPNKPSAATPIGPSSVMRRTLPAFTDAPGSTSAAVAD